MKTISTCSPLAPFTTLSRPSRMASFWSAATEQALEMALRAVISVALFFMAIGVAALAIEMTRAPTMAGPFGLAALALLAAAGFRTFLLLAAINATRSSAPVKS